ncbi:unnamed protein product, partial [Heligmosomoides polygyrus]|uniref:Nucleotide exchange factor GrpE n=1 Tax=Heligmosomoides polygyrus TaxID=6339 RepID=A0A183GWZ2_HELPZ
MDNNEEFFVATAEQARLNDLKNELKEEPVEQSFEDMGSNGDAHVKENKEEKV